jgi:hypothetical protein
MVTQEDFDNLLARVEALEGKVKRKNRVPLAMVPTQEHQDYAGMNNLSVSDELYNFRLYHEGKGTLSANWNSSFSTWLRNAVKYKRNSISDKKQDDADRVLGRGIYHGAIGVNHGSLT